IELILIQSHDLRGRVAIAAAAAASESAAYARRRQHLSQAEGAARRLDRVGSTWAAGLAAALRAGRLTLSGGGRRRGAGAGVLESLAVAETAFEAANMEVHAHFARRARALVSDSSADLAASEADLARCGVRRPDLLSRVFLPGRW
ncbi:MAG: hypothetical protein AAF725_05940, partial [Acidobacteriota bacterium]